MARARVAPGQCPLFGDATDDLGPVAGAPAPRFAAAPTAEQRAAWISRFERAPYVLNGETVEGWKCPACGDVEWNEGTLSTNHGYTTWAPGSVPYARGWGETCVKLEMQRNHAIGEALRAKLAADLEAGCARYPWPGSQPCPACDGRLEHGDRIARGSKGKLVHAACAPVVKPTLNR